MVCGCAALRDGGQEKHNPGGMQSRGDRGLRCPLYRGRGVVATDTKVIERRVSAERLAPYRAVVGGDRNRAIELYVWNADIASAFWALLGHLEVLVRNAMHEQLETWSVRTYGQPTWYTTCGQLFNEETNRDLATARRRATMSGRAETSGRVIAELPLGFWRFLLASRYERVLWRTCLYKGFPGQGRRRLLFDKASALHHLRNRIAHHEPVHNRPLEELHRDLLDVADWVCPVTREWIASQSKVPQVLAMKP